jgi:hypothetical protein
MDGTCGRHERGEEIEESSLLLESRKETTQKIEAQMDVWD